MNSYAPNPSSSDDTGYAPLTAGLLARKGEAMPAVDANAHAGVDIDMRPMRPANGGPSEHVSEKTIESLKRVKPETGSPGVRNNVHAFQSRPELPSPSYGSVKPAPLMDAAPAEIAPADKARSWLKERAPREIAAAQQGPKATVTFRMPARDFIRLRFGARDLELTCQTVILEALDCYLDANEVEQVSDEICALETVRLLRTAKKGQGTRRG